MKLHVIEVAQKAQGLVSFLGMITRRFYPSAIVLFIALSLAGCSVFETPIPISPFESEAKGQKTETHANPGTNSGIQAEQKIKPPPTVAKTPPASTFLVRWSLPASALNVREFKLDYGTNTKTLDHSVRVQRNDLQSQYSATNTELIYKYPLTMPGLVESLSVRVTAVQESGQQTESTIFTSKRVGETRSAE